jgi:vitamin B12 transporter
MSSPQASRPAALRSCALAAFTLSSFAALAQQAQQAADPVVVTANRVAQPLSTVLGDVSVVERTAIERSGASNVAEVLARLPGIEFARSGGPGGTTSVYIRGGDQRHVAVYLDGVRLDSQTTGGALWEQIPLDQIERIEVLRGPAAAVYGSDAVSGVVQLFTKRGKGGIRPSASVSIGSYRTLQAQAGLSGAADAIDYAVSGSHGRSDGYNARTVASANPDDDGWRRSSVTGRVGFQLAPQHRLDASLLASNLRAQYDGSLNADDISYHTLRTGSLAWQGRWSEVSNSRLQVSESRSTYETQPNFYRTETTLRNYTFQHEQRLGSQRLTLTAERREDELLNPATPFSSVLEGERSQDGLSLGWLGDFGEHALQAHVRHDKDSEFGGKSTGSLAWGWRFTPQWRVTASAATSFRAPTLYQRFSEYGVSSLTPENGRNVELGLRWSAGGSELGLVGWRNKVSDLINFGDPGQCLSPFGCYQNVGHAQLKGLTLSGRTRVADVSLHGSLDWHDPKNVETGKLLRRRAKRLATFGAETEMAGWSIGTDVQAAGLRFEDDANKQRLGGYALLGLYVGRQLMPGLMLEARVDNLADKQYELARGYATAGRSGQVTLRWAME